MDFELFDDYGPHLGRFSPASGIDSLDWSLQKRQSRWPEFNRFIHRGEAKVTRELVGEIRDCIKAHKTKSSRRSVSLPVRDIASALLQTLEKLEGKLVWIGL